MTVVLILAFWLPFAVALLRRHPSRWAIFWSLFLLGWTGIGWIVAFIWSFTTPHPKVTA